MTRAEEAPVLVVGSGPVGMVLALGLARFGVRCILIDPGPGRVEPGSKAVLMHREALEVLAAAGVGEEVAARGVAWRRSRTYHRHRLLVESVMPAVPPDLLPPVVNFPQSGTESLLLERVRAEPLITCWWEHTLVGVQHDAEGVDASLVGPTGPRRIRARYLAGCDGARSSTRKLMGVPFRGHGHDDSFLIADIRARLPFPDERRFYFDPPFNPGRTVLIHPQPDSVWHVDWQVGAEVDCEDERRSGRLDARIRTLVGTEVPYEVLWTTTYRFRQLIADRFRIGRVFLVGDAAHLTSPYGARGLNSGLSDADNLAWKLALVLAGAAPEGLLDSYDTERRPAAAENLRITGATARFLSPLTRAQRVRRDLILAGATRVPIMRRFVDSGRLYSPADYGVRRSVPTRAVVALPWPWRRRRVRPLGVGELAPDASCRVLSAPPGEVPDEGKVRRLRHLLRKGFAVLVLPGSSGDLGPWHDALEDAAQRREHRGPPVRLVLVTPGEAGEPHAPTRRVIVVRDPEQEVLRAYSPDAGQPLGRLFLVRPDGYIAAQHTLSVRPSAAQLVPLLDPAPSLASVAVPAVR